MLEAILHNVRTQCPLIHNITNYVTVNDAPNATLAIGASPIMADALEEAANIAYGKLPAFQKLHIGRAKRNLLEVYLAR